MSAAAVEWGGMSEGEGDEQAEGGLDWAGVNKEEAEEEGAACAAAGASAAMLIV